MNRHIGASAYTLGGELHSFLSLPTSLPSQRRSRRTLRPSALKTSEAGDDLEGFINFKALSPCKPFSHRVHRVVRAKAASHPEQGRQTSGSRPTQNALLVEPLSVLDVDAELWQVLDLCSDEELEAVYSVLHAPSPFSPVVKSLVTENEPPLLLQRGRLSLMHKIESRFRFLAADQASLFRGARPCYRDTLLAIRDRMDVPCSTNLSTFDLETEVFLHVLNNCLEYVQSDGMSGNPNEAAARATMQDGDGMSSSSPKRPNWVERATAPIMFGFKELLPTLAKLGSAITVTAVGRSTASQLAQQLACSHLRYQAAARFVASAASRGVTSGSALAGWGKQAVLESAAKGLQAATARYSALQGALSFIGPVMWGWLAVDLAFKAIGTDYARVIRAVFILAQVRLLRTNGFTNPPEVQISSFSTVITDDGPVVLASQSDDLMDLWDEEERGTHGEGYGQGPTRALVGPGTELLGPGHGFDDGDDTDDPYTDCNNVYN